MLFGNKSSLEKRIKTNLAGGGSKTASSVSVEGGESSSLNQDHIDGGESERDIESPW